MSKCLKALQNKPLSFTIQLKVCRFVWERDILLNILFRKCYRNICTDKIQHKTNVCAFTSLSDINPSRERKFDLFKNTLWMQVRCWTNSIKGFESASIVLTIKLFRIIRLFLTGLKSKQWWTFKMFQISNKRFITKILFQQFQFSYNQCERDVKWILNIYLQHFKC